jgi:NAD(P)-dependent dehydrogenase (short-subunit alcohol dehydrogenase family)
MTSGNGAMTGQAALVTGASKGIGRDLALGLAAAGASVVVNYKTDARGAEDVCRQIAESGIGRAIAAQGDVGVSRQARALVDQTVAEFGRIDLLVNNAGRTRFGPAHAVTDEDFDDVVNTNLRGTFFASVGAAEQMQRQGGGSIVNISSCAAELAIPDHSIYTMSKGGLEALSRQLAFEYAPTVRVNVIAPAPTSIDRNYKYNPNFDSDWGGVIPMRRVARTDDFVGPLIFLATDASRFLTGEVLHVDGGWSLQGRVPQLDGYDYSPDAPRG